MRCSVVSGGAGSHSVGRYVVARLRACTLSDDQIVVPCKADTDPRRWAGQVIFEDRANLGYTYPMTDIQAAMGWEQLERLCNRSA